MAGSTGRGFDAESLLRSLMENVPGAIYRAANDDSWKVQRVNDDIERITGYPVSDFVDASKQTIVEVTHPDDREQVDQEIRAALAAGRPYVLEFRIMHADGGIRWVLERGVKTIDRDGVEWLDGIIFDITERREAEQLRMEREMEALRVAELEASRMRIVAAADAARHRIERDLHDGAQQRLLVASLQLSAAERAAQRGEAFLPLVRAARVQTALYYTVAEALTNVDRYAGATRATVRLRLDGDAVEVEIEDDGRGGADRARGSGLRGLEDRLGTVGGVLEVASPPGG